MRNRANVFDTLKYFLNYYKLFQFLTQNKKYVRILKQPAEERAKKKFDTQSFCRAPDKVHISISIMPISSPRPMFDHLFESSYLLV